MSVIDVSGFSFSGKSAVYDLLSSSKSFYGFGRNFEFELLRAPGGILELREALTGENWSPVRSSDAIRKFLRLVANLGGNKTNIDRVTKLGNHYDYYFPNFTEISIQYVDNLVANKWSSFWPYAKFQYNLLEVINYKLLNNIGFSTHDNVYLSRLKSDEFDAYTGAYLKILFPPHGNKLGQTLVINNAFEPFNPSISLNLIKDSKSIVVDRDPRDIYLSAIISSKQPGAREGAAVVGKNVKDFINRFHIYRSAVVINDNPNVLRITFERLIKNYNQTLLELIEFLNVEQSNFETQHTNFDITRSMQNIGMWHELSDDSLIKDIKFIESELKDYCCN